MLLRVVYVGGRMSEKKWECGWERTTIGCILFFVDGPDVKYALYTGGMMQSFRQGIANTL